MSEIITVQPRNIQTVTTEIRTIVRQTQQVMLSAAIEIGRRLTEAKGMVPYGEWGSYLRDEVEFSQSSANNFMRLFEEYGDRQESLFSVDSQALENLPYTKALRLLAIPAEERAEFAAEHDVENLSTRELEKAIRERDDALAAKTAAEQAKKDADQSAIDMAKDIENIKRQKEEADQKSELLVNEVKNLKDKLNKAQAAERAANQKVSELRENPSLPEKLMEQMRSEVQAEDAEKVLNETEAALSGARERVRQIEQEKKSLQDRLETAQKQILLLSPEAAVYRACFNQVKQDFANLLMALDSVKKSDAELGAKLTEATFKLLDKLRGEVPA